MKRVNAFVGSPVERIEDLRFLRGRGQFVDDLTRDDQLFAAILRSSHAHGRIRSIETGAARARPGVHAVITAADIGNDVPTIPLRLQPMEAIEPFKQPAIAHRKVRYVGEPLAVVVADSAALAEDALEAIAVDIEPLTPVVEWPESLKDIVLLFEDAGTNIASRFVATKGDADAAFSEADYVRRERLAVQRHTALPMETRGLLAEWDATSGRLTVSGAAKVPFFNRRAVAAMMGLPEESVDLIEYDVGGGFGARGEFYPEDFLIPFAARVTGRPVKWIEDRREHLIAMNHAREAEGELEIACRRDGTVIGLRGTVYINVGAYVRSNGLTAPRNLVQFLSGPYRIPNIHLESVVVMSNKTPCGTYRAPGRFEGSFFCDRLMDLAAHDLGIDPPEIRRRNLIREAEIPYTLASVSPADLYAETQCDSGDYSVTLERCLEEFGWTEKSALNGKLIDGRYHGIGLGCFIEGGAAGPRENARIDLEPDGTVSVYVGSCSLGQGLETVLTQIAADALELPMEHIRLLHGSTTHLDEGFGAYHSRSTVMGGSAILLAANSLKDKIRRAAAERLGCNADDVTLADWSVRSPSAGPVAVGELGLGKLSATEAFSNHHKHTYAYGTGAAHVAVDPGTGHVELIDYLVVEDVGRIVNPLTLHGQVIGATVQGMGSVFLEHLVYDGNGQLLAGSLADYMIPVMTDFPNIRAETFGQYPSPTNPLGVKGAGEGGIICVGGVVANAVANAIGPTGAIVRRLPLSPPAVWSLIHDTAPPA